MTKYQCMFISIKICVLKLDTIGLHDHSQKNRHSNLLFWQTSIFKFMVLCKCFCKKVKTWVKDVPVAPSIHQIQPGAHTRKAAAVQEMLKVIKS